MIAGLANGTLAFFTQSSGVCLELVYLGVFLRHELYLWLVIVIFLGTWNLQSQEVLSLGTTPLQPVRCCLAKEGCLWVGYWNKVYLISVKIRKVEVGLGWKRCH